MDGDIEGAIIDALNTVFTHEMIDGVPANDPLKLNRLIEIPLQDDPTRVAPYLVYGPAYELGRLITGETGFEIGAGPLWRTYFKAIVGTPQQNTRNAAYKAINELTRRAERAIFKHYDLSNVSAPGILFSEDGSEFIDAMNPERMYTRTLRRIYGGSGTFFGEGMLIWSYTFRRPKDW